MPHRPGGLPCATSGGCLGPATRSAGSCQPGGLERHLLPGGSRTCDRPDAVRGCPVEHGCRRERFAVPSPNMWGRADPNSRSRDLLSGSPTPTRRQCDACCRFKAALACSIPTLSTSLGRLTYMGFEERIRVWPSRNSCKGRARRSGCVSAASRAETAPLQPVASQSSPILRDLAKRTPGLQRRVRARQGAASLSSPGLVAAQRWESYLMSPSTL